MDSEVGWVLEICRTCWKNLKTRRPDPSEPPSATPAAAGGGASASHSALSQAGYIDRFRTASGVYLSVVAPLCLVALDCTTTQRRPLKHFSKVL